MIGASPSVSTCVNCSRTVVSFGVADRAKGSRRAMICQVLTTVTASAEPALLVFWAHDGLLDSPVDDASGHTGLKLSMGAERQADLLAARRRDCRRRRPRPTPRSR